MIRVGLNWNEVAHAADVGIRRFTTPIQQGQHARYGAERSWDNEISSCLAELAVAKYTSQYWYASPATDTQTITNDVGTNLEVRCARTGGRLIVREADKDDHMYVLAYWPEWCPKGAILKVLGGILAKDAKQDRWRDAPAGRPPAYFVPVNELTPAEEILTNRYSD